MRLINITTWELEEHASPPPYAILSHRWEADEVSLQDFYNPASRIGKGFRKIRAFCRTVQRYGKSINYVWMDTCCIDKTSSAELSEAINSMFRWYKNAPGGCFVYLHDVEHESELGESEWFTRGWTLQELIAPQEVRFYNRDWRFLNSKRNMCTELAAITGIDVGVLSGQTSIFDCSVACRMSWATDRVTTRVEDRAYSLMGLFDVNMPMLYGEGEKSFYRLQQEIIRESDDQSIFAWSTRTQSVLLKGTVGTDQDLDNLYSFGLIARSIDDFANCQNIRTCGSLIHRLPYSLTNIGLSMTLLVLPWTMYVYIGVLNCQGSSQDTSQRCCIFLLRLEEPDQFARISVNGQDCVYLSDEQGSVLFRQIPAIPKNGLTVRVRPRVRAQQRIRWHYGFLLSRLTTICHGDIPPTCVSVYRRVDNVDTNPDLLLLPDGEGGTVAAIVLRHLLPYNKVIYIRLGFDFDFHPVALVTLETAVESDPSGFLRPPDHQFRAEEDCELHSWLKEVVQNDGRYFTSRPGTLVVEHQGRACYDQASMAVVLLLERDVLDGVLCWKLSLMLDIDALRRMTWEVKTETEVGMVIPNDLIWPHV